MNESGQTLAAPPRDHRPMSELSFEEKRALLARMLAEEAGREDVFPLSFSQQRLWFLDQLQPGNPAYNVGRVFRLRGLCLDVLRASLEEIVQRHDTLRTRFETRAGEPVQVVAPEVELDLPLVDLAGVPPAPRLAAARDLIQRTGQAPFDLGRAPLLRVLAIRLDAADAVVQVAMHHIISDGWSLGILMREMAELYRAFTAGRPSPLPALPVRYGDYVEWQRDWLRGERLERLLTYWRTRLGDGRTVLELPTDRPRPAVQTFRGAARRLTLPARLSASLRELGRRQGVTLYTILLAAFQLLLHRYSGQGSIAVGTPVGGRSRVELEALIGLFVNTLVLTTSLTGDPTLRELLRRVHEVCLGAYDHQDVPLERLMDELRPDRDMSYSPLFQVALALQNTPQLEIAGVDRLGLRQEISATKFDLAFELAESDRGIGGHLEYNRDLFDASTIGRLVGHYARILDAMAASPDLRLGSLELGSPAERHQLLAEWSDTGRPCPQEPMVHELFAEHARRRPSALALVDSEGRRLTYGELEARANRLAHRLAGLGVGPDVMVAICTGRTLTRAVSIVSVLKAGGAYVSIDPTHPPERLAFLLGDARAPVLLTEESFLGVLPSSAPHVICADADHAGGCGDGSRPPAVSLLPENLAYVVYTSGSTGKPKGVAIPHAGLMNLVRWHQGLYAVTPEDHGTQVASPSFDASIWEFWPYLSAGAALHIPDEETRLSSARMIRWWSEQGITLAYLMTPLAEGVLAEKIPSDLDLSVRALIIGGDRLHGRPGPTVGFRLMNHYGPAEYSVTCTVVEVPPAGRGKGIPTIGRPVDNTGILLFDRYLRTVPIGVPGELYVGGIGLARGYLSRPAMTAEKFVAHPFAASPGERLYRTGDLVRFLADGDMDFLGRLDHQVKLRGLRIELSEIEAALNEHPAVREAAVLTRSPQDRPGTKHLVGYVAAPAARRPEAEELREFLQHRLPAYMVPRIFVFLDGLPLSPNGKVDRKALPEPEWRSEAAYVAPETPLEERVAAIWAEVLELEKVGLDDNVFDLGGHSLSMVRIRQRLRDDLEVDLALVELFQNPTVRALAEHLDRPGRGARAPVATRSEQRRRPMAGGPAAVAVIGMAGRFPGARDVEAFWENLRRGVGSITRFTDEEMIEAGVDPRIVRDPRFVAAAGVIEDPEHFDAEFFGFNPREAQVMDPQHRLFLECAWQALDDAGYGSPEGRGSVGLFAGTSMSTYLPYVLADPELRDLIGLQQILISNDKDHLPTRTSYKLDLKGPSVSVQTACSTSLVAVHLACQSLLLGECDMAMAGGVSIKVPIRQGYLFEEGGILSPHGECRAFDAGAAGTVGGNGVAVVVLKPLAAALEDGDSIYAVVRGTAVNNDGAAKVGYTAPSISGQAAVIAEAQEIAGFDPRSVGYVEAHGSGTRLGDPIEIAALEQAFGRGDGRRNGRCAIGSVKTNVGHLDAAAGVTGLIKTVLALGHDEIPPSLHFEQPNPEIDFAGSPFYVNTRLAPWPAGDRPRRAGVSSFGIGGTNVHAVLEQAPTSSGQPSARPWQLLVVSGRTESARARAAAELGRRLGRLPELDLADVAYTLQVGRTHFEHRQAVVCRDAAGALGALEGRQPERAATGRRVLDRPKVAFLFPGLGEQHAGMGRELYEAETVFRQAFDECAERLRPELDTDLGELLFKAPPADGPAETGSRGPDLRALLGRVPRGEDSAAWLRSARLAQPALFAFEYALARLWTSWGVAPRAMLGYSLGEYVAACLAEVFSLEDALTLVARRGALIDELPPGAMMAVPLSEADVEPCLGAGVFLSAVIGPELCVLGGVPEEIDACRERLAASGLETRRVATSHAFHSAMMEPIVEPFRRLLASVELRAPKLPYVSNVTGGLVGAAEATDPDFWVEHLRRPVRFSAGLEHLWQEPQRVLLEVGPGKSLGSLALQHPASGGGGHRLALASLPGRHDRQPETAFLLRSLGRLWLAGLNPDWAAVHAGENRRRVHLPPYPFEGRRHWVAEGVRLGRPAATRLPIEEWTSLPRWREASPTSLLPPLPAAGRWLVFLDRTGLGAAVADRLSAAGAGVTTVRPGAAFTEESPGTFRIHHRDADHYAELLTTLAERGESPGRIVHLWNVSGELGFAADGNGDATREFEATQEWGFFSLLHLARAVSALDDANGAPPVELAVVTDALFAVDGDEEICPAKATVLGPVHVVARELAHVTSRLVDLATVREASLPRHAELLVEELTRAGDEEVVALRRGRRWTRHYERVSLPAPEAGERPALLAAGRPDRPTYLVTGGLGGLGPILARYLAGRTGANLVLLSRTELPERSAWASIAAGEAGGDAERERIRAVREIEALGSRVQVLAADMCDRAALESAVGRVRAAHGRIDGVFHVAGIPGGGLIRFRDPGDAARVLGVKAAGAQLLIEVLRHDPPDFLVLYSSLDGLTGSVGQVDYTAANAYLDALATSRPLGGRTAVVSIDWDGWQEVGMGARAEEKMRIRFLDQAIRPDEGAAVFERVFHHRLAQVVVSTRDLHERIAAMKNRQDDGLVRGAEPAESGSKSPRPALHTAYEAPRTTVEKALAELWQDLLGIDRVGVHDDFFDLGGHSLLALRLVPQIRRRLGADISVHLVFEAPTAARLAQSLEALLQGEAPAPKSPLVPLRTEGTEPPLFFVHPAGGYVLGYRELAGLLGPRWPFYGLQARGVEGDEEPCRRVEDMARSYLEAVRQTQPEGPYFLGGWSFGGTVAFEMARQLEAAGETVACLAVGDMSSPGEHHRQDTTFDDAEILAAFAQENALAIDRDSLAELGRDERAARVADLAVAAGLLPPEGAAGHLRRFLEVFKASCEAGCAYDPEPYQGRITLLRTGAGTSGQAETLGADYGWSRFTSGQVEIVEVPGTHMSAIHPPHVATLATTLRRLLDEATSRGVTSPEGGTSGHEARLPVAAAGSLYSHPRGPRRA